MKNLVATVTACSVFALLLVTGNRTALAGNSENPESKVQRTGLFADIVKEIETRPAAQKAQPPTPTPPAVPVPQEIITGFKVDTPSQAQSKRDTKSLPGAVANGTGTDVDSGTDDVTSQLDALLKKANLSRVQPQPEDDVTSQLDALLKRVKIRDAQPAQPRATIEPLGTSTAPDGPALAVLIAAIIATLAIAVHMLAKDLRGVRFFPKKGSMSMNQKRTGVLWVGVTLIGVLLIFPPWRFNLDRNGVHLEKLGPYSFLLVPPKPENEMWSVRLDTSRMFVPVALLTMITGALLFTLRDRADKPTK